MGDVTDPARNNDIWHTQTMLRAALAGEVEIITSTLTIAECRRAGTTPVPPATKELIRAMLLFGRVILLAQVTQSITERARDFDWDHQLKLGGADAIHLATALTTKCKEFFTFDEGPLKAAETFKTLGLNVIRPSQTNLLDPKYKQRKLLPPDTKSEPKLSRILLSP